MLFIDATLFKNQLYKVKNQINKVPIISKQDSIEFFSNISARHFNVCNLFSCYHNGRILICQYQGVMLRGNVKLFCQFFVNFLIIRTRLWLLAWSKVNFYPCNFKKNKWPFSLLLLNIVTLEIRTPVHSNCVSKFHQYQSFSL